MCIDYAISILESRIDLPQSLRLNTPKKPKTCVANAAHFSCVMKTLKSSKTCQYLILPNNQKHFSCF